MANKSNYKGKKTKKEYVKKDDVKEAKFEDHRDSKINDITHHAKDPVLLKDAASFAYSNALGTIFNWALDSSDNGDSIPGVCALVTHPMIGRAEAWNDTINISSRSLYSWIRHANSGSKNYDAPDLMMYIYAMANLDSMIEWAKRLYGICANYSFRNRYIPKALVEANGVDFEGLTNNLANYRYGLNMAIRKRNSLAVPKNMAVYQRQKWMYSGIYMDANNPKAQVYMFVPDGFYILNQGGGVDATHCIYAKFSGNYGSMPDEMYTWDWIIDSINMTINAIWSVEDFNIMSGDILKAYGESGVDFVEEITDTFTTNIGYEFEVLSEIQNATVLHCNVTDDTIYQNTDIGKGFIYSHPRLSFTDPALGTALCERRMITVPYPDPTPQDTMIATRLTVIPKADGTFGDEFSYGTELVTGMRICTVEKKNNDTVLVWHNTYGYATRPDVIGDYFADFMDNLGAIAKFDYHPMVSVKIIENGEDVLHYKPIRLMDVDNYTLMNPVDLKKMHDLSTWTQFYWGNQ